MFFRKFTPHDMHRPETDEITIANELIQTLREALPQTDWQYLQQVVDDDLNNNV